MEVVGAVASVLTLLGAAVKGTEALRQIISEFKDVSSHIRHLDLATKSLNLVLTQLKSSDALVQDLSTRQNFQKLLKEYGADLKRYEDYMRKIQDRSKESKAKRFSKKLKNVISGEKDILGVLEEITQRCTMLGAQLNVFQYNATLTVKDTVLELNAAASASANHDVNQSKLLLQQSTELSAINGRVEHVQTSMSAIQDAVTSMNERMEQIPQVSRAQKEDICTLLLALHAQISGLANRHTDRQHISQSQSTHTSDNGGAARDDSTLFKSIQRLESVASEKEGVLFDEEANLIIDDLENILQAVMGLPDNRHTTSSKRKFNTLGESGDVSTHEMKRLCGMVASSQSISLNTGSPRSKLAMSQKILQKRKAKEVQTQGYSITVELNERRFSSPHNRHSRLAHQYSTVETITRVKVISHAMLPTTLMAYLRRVEEHSGFASLNPSISVGKTLPNDSPIFGIVMDGDVDQLKRLLAQRKCTLRDRDSFGTPLLHYAMTQPTMCKFLIDNGADIDEMAPRVGFRKYICTPLSAHFNDSGQGAGEIRSIIECRSFLLQAGADPMICSLDRAGTFPMLWEYPLAYAIDGGTVDSLKCILDHGGPFINIDEGHFDADIPLMQLADNVSDGYDAMKFKLLLDRGANIHARNHGGLTCLHKAVVRARTCKNEMEAIVLLVQCGANIFTTDNLGRSIFDDAYDCDHEEYRPLGGYRGDLWDAVLAQCGYESYIRRPEQRLCHYTVRYSREDFERLWKGREHLCPYFSDSSAVCHGSEVLSGPDIAIPFWELETSEDESDQLDHSQ